MIKADVEGCGGFTSFGFGVDTDGVDAEAELWVAIELAELSPAAGALFFFLAIAKICCNEDLGRGESCENRHQLRTAIFLCQEPLESRTYDVPVPTI